MANILVVDDELGIRELLFEILDDEGHSVELAENAAQARAHRQRYAPDLVLLDIWMPDTDGVTLLKEWSATGLLTMPVIMMSGHATIDTAVEATRIGAMAFLEKPITLQKLLQAVEKGLARGPVRPNGRANAAGPAAPTAGGAPALTLVGTTPASSVASDDATPDPDAAAAEGAAALRPGVLTVPAAPGGVLQTLDLDAPLREARDAFEKAYFEFHLAKEHGSMTRVAEKTGLERTHLYRKLKQLGVDLSRNKRSAA
ncbi:response regulator [Tepidimonas taiwanensis]|uniref:Sporulation initiation phosphotransferase F n=1 Tax=Tepidimonas taiwanensis TaxID=307486 RepID=A0A554X1E3_9BURK|nr:response regulator [Tepidimonas taiwanensis]TSE29682.1 Sporulation initiation phosphotransferase F [Tepidimonas taiwanensis]UBQ05479.1 response regulator [Tepidimonas taiwanensis]